MSKTARDRLFNKDFLLLWLGQAVSQLGNGAGFIAIMWWIQETTGSGLALGTLAMVNGIVMTCLGPFGGVIADRFDRKQIIVWTDIIRGVIYCGFAYLAWTDQLSFTVLLIGSALSSACSSFFGPAISAAIPLLVPDEDLERANSMRQVTMRIVSIVSYAAGGILVALLGVPLLMFVDGISFLMSAASEMFIVIPDVRQSGQRFNWNTMVLDLKDGFLYIKENTVLFKIMQVAMVLNFFGVPFFILMPKFVGEHMGAGSDVYGYLLSASMVGALIATLIISLTSLVKRNLWIVKWGIVFQAVLMLTLPFLPRQYWMIHAAVMFVTGCINAIVNIYFSTVMQRITRPEYMGKVFGLLGTMSSALTPVAQGLTGLIADLVRLPIIYTASSGTSALFGVQFALIPNIDSFLKAEKRQDVPAGEAEPVTAD